MIKPLCIKCCVELQDFGAILLSPPKDDNTVEKYHICKTCYELTAKFLLEWG